MIGYFLTFMGGMLFGIVTSCILLAKKNLEKAQRIENQVEQNFQAVKGAYKAYVNDESSAEESEE